AILATAALCALVAQLAWSSRGRVADAASHHAPALRVALALASGALYLAHAFAYVRLYPGLHAIAAAGAVALLVAALAHRGPPPARGSRERAASVVRAGPVALFALCAGA